MDFAMLEKLLELGALIARAESLKLITSEQRVIANDRLKDKIVSEVLSHLPSSVG